MFRKSASLALMYMPRSLMHDYFVEGGIFCT